MNNTRNKKPYTVNDDPNYPCAKCQELIENGRCTKGMCDDWTVWFKSEWRMIRRALKR
jgi:hypothetical protein